MALNEDAKAAELNETPRKQGQASSSATSPSSFSSKYEDDLRSVRMSLSTFTHGDCVELEMYRLQEMILLQLMDPNTQKEQLAVEKAHDIFQMMKVNGCNNASSFVEQMKDIHSAVSRNSFAQAWKLSVNLLSNMQPLRIHEITWLKRPEPG